MKIPEFKIHSTCFIIFISIAVISCSRDYNPKPKGYNRIDLPPHEYVKTPDSLPYSFAISKFARIDRDTSWVIMNEMKERVKPDSRLSKEKYWIDVVYDTLGAKIEITYKEIHNKEDLAKAYVTDAIKLTNQHQVKASGIDESIVRTRNGLTASIAELRGEVPSQVQFITTDSTQHFLRGALYFKTATKNDSLAPVINYIKTDIIHLLNTLQWKKTGD